MSYAVGVDILLYASDAGSPMHGRAADFIRRCASGREVICLAWVSIMSFLRMATHPAMFARPLTPEEAGRNVEAHLRLPHCRVISEEEGFWERYGEVTRDLPARGDLVPDAHSPRC